MGIARQTQRPAELAQLRNWEFFRAPVAAVVCMHRDLGLVDALGVGMFLQTFVLALTERGPGSVCSVDRSAYPDILRDQLDIPDELTVLCGMSIGYADPAFPANNLKVPRNPVAERGAPRQLTVRPPNSSLSVHGHVTMTMPFREAARRPCSREHRFSSDSR